MKILMVNTSDIKGGAARAAYRLHKALLDIGVASQMLVQDKFSDDFTVIGPSTKLQKLMGKLRPTMDQLITKFFKNKSKMLFSPSWLPFSNIVDKINKINPDIVHLHWICGGMMKIQDIAKIKVPIVWSLHDMWAFTDGYHYDDNFDICKNGCIVEHKNFLSTSIFKRKKKSYSQKKDMTIVGLSRWLNECSKSSTLLKNKKHVNLPNPIDIGVFKPFDKEKSRELWDLPKKKKLILYGAMSATSDPRKGFKELSEAVVKMRKTDSIELVVFGSSKPQSAPDFGFKTYYLGCLSDDISLVTLYSAVDVMVVPSLQEAFGQTASESMACGTPVVAFCTTGLLDIIDHKLNGYLAKPFDTTDLKNGIEWVLNASNYDELCVNAREKVVREFDSKVVAKKYIELYEEILSEK